MKGSEMGTVVLCDRCDGSGRIQWAERIAGHELEIREHDEQCPECEGSGRFIKTVTITYEPVGV